MHAPKALFVVIGRGGQKIDAGVDREGYQRGEGEGKRQRCKIGRRRVREGRTGKTSDKEEDPTKFFLMERTCFTWLLWPFCCCCGCFEITGTREGTVWCIGRLYLLMLERLGCLRTKEKSVVYCKNRSGGGWGGYAQIRVRRNAMLFN